MLTRHLSTSVLARTSFGLPLPVPQMELNLRLRGFDVLPWFLA